MLNRDIKRSMAPGCLLIYGGGAKRTPSTRNLSLESETRLEINTKKPWHTHTFTVDRRLCPWTLTGALHDWWPHREVVFFFYWRNVSFDRRQSITDGATDNDKQWHEWWLLRVYQAVNLVIVHRASALRFAPQRRTSVMRRTWRLTVVSRVQA